MLRSRVRSRRVWQGAARRPTSRLSGTQRPGVALAPFAQRLERRSGSRHSQPTSPPQANRHRPRPRHREPAGPRRDLPARLHRRGQPAVQPRALRTCAWTALPPDARPELARVVADYDERASAKDVDGRPELLPAPRRRGRRQVRRRPRRLASTGGLAASSTSLGTVEAPRPGTTSALALRAPSSSTPAPPFGQMLLLHAPGHLRRSIERSPPSSTASSAATAAKLKPTASPCLSRVGYGLTMRR